MNGQNKHDMVALCILALFMIVTLIFLIIPRQTNEERSEPSVPYDYHVFYDDNGKVIIAPNEYHFTTNSKGNTVLTK